MGDAHVTSAKDIGALLDLSPESVEREIATYPDPLPARRYRGTLCGKRERFQSWNQRRRAKVHPVPGLAVVTGCLRIGDVVRLSAVRVKQLAPWSTLAGEDPLPLWRDAEGKIHAYRDALLDWIERHTERASAPRFQRATFVTEKKRRRRASKTGGARERATGNRARSGSDADARVKRLAKERRAA